MQEPINLCATCTHRKQPNKDRDYECQVCDEFDNRYEKDEGKEQKNG